MKKNACTNLLYPSLYSFHNVEQVQYCKSLNADLTNSTTAQPLHNYVSTPYRLLVYTHLHSPNKREKESTNPTTSRETSPFPKSHSNVCMFATSNKFSALVRKYTYATRGGRLSSPSHEILIKLS